VRTSARYGTRPSYGPTAIFSSRGDRKWANDIWRYRRARPDGTNANDAMASSLPVSIFTENSIYPILADSVNL